MKHLKILLLISLITFTFTACGKTTEPDENSVKEVPEIQETTAAESMIKEPGEWEKIFLDGELSVLIGTGMDTDIQKLKSIGSFQCLLNSNKQIMSITTADPALTINGISPQSSLDDVITELLADHWSYQAEYFWYSEIAEAETIACYQSAVFEKENFEYVITTNTEENYGNVCAVELIDKDLYENPVDSTKETIFAHLHGLL